VAATPRATTSTGSGIYLPMIQRSVEAYFGRSGLIDFDPTEVVALGAGLAATVS